MNWHNLIAVCYFGGTCGHAIAAVINHSADIFKHASADNIGVSPTGEMRHHFVRLGRLDGYLYDIEYCHNKNNLPYRPDQPISEEALSHWSADVAQLLSPDNSYGIQAVLEHNRLVVADHVNARNQQRLTPGSKIIAVYGGLHRAVRNFADKKLVVPEDYDSLKRAGIDYFSRHMAISHSKRDRYMLNLRTFTNMHLEFNAIQLQTQGVFHLDWTDLIDPIHRYETYHRLTDYLGITPEWKPVNAFLDYYNTRQITRLSRKVLLTEHT